MDLNFDIPLRDALDGKRFQPESRPRGLGSGMGASLLEGSVERLRPERELGIARRSRLHACTTRTGERAAWG